jgi:hypothetical protein
LLVPLGTTAEHSRTVYLALGATAVLGVHAQGADLRSFLAGAALHLATAGPEPLTVTTVGLDEDLPDLERISPARDTETALRIIEASAADTGADDAFPHVGLFATAPSQEQLAQLEQLTRAQAAGWQRSSPTRKPPVRFDSNSAVTAGRSPRGTSISTSGLLLRQRCGFSTR